MELFSSVGTKLQGKNGLYLIQKEIGRGGMGATFSYLLAGRLPPRSVARMMPLSVDVIKKLTSLRKLNPTVSKCTDQVIANSMEFDPEERYQSARQMRQALCPPRRFILLPF